jgi:hypothetical protein
MGMRHVSAKFIPWLLTAEQKEHYLSVATDLLECAQADKNFFKIIVAYNEI